VVGVWLASSQSKMKGFTRASTQGGHLVTVRSFQSVFPENVGQKMAVRLDQMYGALKACDISELIPFILKYIYGNQTKKK